MTITKNSVQCLQCDTIIESKLTTERVSCACGNISIEGGHDYLKRIGGDFDTYKELSKYTYANEDFWPKSAGR